MKRGKEKRDWKRQIEREKTKERERDQDREIKRDCEQREREIGKG